MGRPRRLRHGPDPDEATFFEPHQHATGIDHVIVNGEFVVDDGEILFELPGTRAAEPERRPAGGVGSGRGQLTC